MSRNTGTFNFAANFEGLLEGPNDAKQLVITYSALTSPSTWNQSGSVWLYNGAIVSVADDVDPTNNAIYYLKDADNYTMTCSWIKAGAGSGTLTGATNGLSIINGGTTVVLGGTLTGDTTFSGGILKYGGDYSGSYDVRSLVDKGYVDTIAVGLQPKTAVWVGTLSDIVLSGLSQIIDGISLTSGMRILVKNQSNPVDNGIYSANTTNWGRTSDFDGTPQGEISQGALVPIISGNTQYNTLWVLTTADPITGGTSPLYFSYFTRPTSLIEGIGIDISGNTISVDGANLIGNSLVWTGNTFNVDINSGTLNTALNSKLDTSNFNIYTGNTDNRLINIENNITGLTATTVNLQNQINYISGVTSGLTATTINLQNQINYISGVTDSKLDINIFTGYTAATNIIINNIENDILYISGITSGLTATTINLQNQINYISGITSGLTISKLDVNVFDAYTGTTQPILNSAITGATNGLTKTGRVVVLGGILTGNTTFNGTGSNYHLKYNADYSSAYSARSIPDVAYVTGYTKSMSNIVAVREVILNNQGTCSEDEFIGAYNCNLITGFTINLDNTPIHGQKVTIADTIGNALTYPIIVYGQSYLINGCACAVINTDYGSISFVFNCRNNWSAISFIN